MRDTSLLQLALGLAPPWTVTGSDFDAEARRLDINLDFTAGSRFTCPSCGATDCPAHDTEQVTWRHLNFFQHQAYLHARVPGEHDTRLWRVKQRCNARCRHTDFECAMAGLFSVVNMLGLGPNSGAILLLQADFLPRRAGGDRIAPDPIDQTLGYTFFGDDHPWLFAMPNGRVFDAGPILLTTGAALGLV